MLAVSTIQSASNSYWMLGTILVLHATRFTRSPTAFEAAEKRQSGLFSSSWAPRTSSYRFLLSLGTYTRSSPLKSG